MKWATTEVGAVDDDIGCQGDSVGGGVGSTGGEREWPGHEVAERPGAKSDGDDGHGQADVGELEVGGKDLAAGLCRGEPVSGGQAPTVLSIRSASKPVGPHALRHAFITAASEPGGRVAR